MRAMYATLQMHVDEITKLMDQLTEKSEEAKMMIYEICEINFPPQLQEGRELKLKSLDDEVLKYNTQGSANITECGEVLAKGQAMSESQGSRQTSRETSPSTGNRYVHYNTHVTSNPAI